MSDAKPDVQTELSATDFPFDNLFGPGVMERQSRLCAIGRPGRIDRSPLG